MTDTPYRVVWGYYGEHREDFATFVEAQVLWAKTPGSSIVNTELLDDGYDGLSYDERTDIELTR